MPLTPGSHSERKPHAADASSRRVLLVLVPPVDELDVVGHTQVLSLANVMAGRRFYDLQVATTGHELVVPGEGGFLSFMASRRLSEVEGPFDDILLVCGVENRRATDPALIEWLQREAPRAQRVGAVCVAVFHLADAGLLDGRRATAHWRFVDEFARRHPKVRVAAAPIWIQDGPMFTSAGVTAGFDMALGWVEDDLGPALATEIAAELVLFARRSGDEAQVSHILTAQAGERRQVRELVPWIHDNLHKPLTVEIMAGRACMSSRTLERAFAREIGRSPARFLLEARIAHARRLLGTTSRSLEQVARASGFATADAMRRAFRRFDGSSPRAYRLDAAALAAEGQARPAAGTAANGEPRPLGSLRDELRRRMG